MDVRGALWGMVGVPRYWRQALRLVRAVRDYLRDECRALMHLDAPAGRLIVVGDLHGHFNDLLHVRHQFGMPSSHNMFLFNGDFVDRGVWGPEVLLTLFCYKLMYKKYVHLNRGNHESVLCTNVYGFKTHLACAYPHHHHLLEPIIQDRGVADMPQPQNVDRA